MSFDPKFSNHLTKEWIVIVVKYDKTTIDGKHLPVTEVNEARKGYESATKAQWLVN